MATFDTSNGENSSEQVARNLLFEKATSRNPQQLDITSSTNVQRVIKESKTCNEAPKANLLQLIENLQEEWSKTKNEIFDLQTQKENEEVEQRKQKTAGCKRKQQTENMNDYQEQPLCAKQKPRISKLTEEIVIVMPETPSTSIEDSNLSIESLESEFLDKYWGHEAIMIRVFRQIKAGVSPVTITSLVDGGPQNIGRKKEIRAKCLDSVMKLNKHLFLKIVRDASSSKIQDIKVGDIFQ